MGALSDAGLLARSYALEGGTTRACAREATVTDLSHLIPVWFLPGAVLCGLMMIKRREKKLTRLECAAWMVPVLALGPLLLLCIIFDRHRQ